MLSPQRRPCIRVQTFPPPDPLPPIFWETAPLIPSFHLVAPSHPLSFLAFECLVGFPFSLLTVKLLAGGSEDSSVQ